MIGGCTDAELPNAGNKDDVGIFGVAGRCGAGLVYARPKEVPGLEREPSERSRSLCLAPDTVACYSVAGNPALSELRERIHEQVEHW